MHRARSPRSRSFIAIVHQRGDRIKPNKRRRNRLNCAFPAPSGPHRSFGSSNRRQTRGRGRERREGRDPFFSTGRSNLGRAKQTRPRNSGRGVGEGVRKGRDDAPGREIFGGEGGGHPWWGVGVWVGVAGSIQGGFVASKRAQPHCYSCFLLSLSLSLLFFLPSWEITFLLCTLYVSRIRRICTTSVEYWVEIRLTR